MTKMKEHTMRGRWLRLAAALCGLVLGGSALAGPASADPGGVDVARQVVAIGSGGVLAPPAPNPVVDPLPSASQPWRIINLKGDQCLAQMDHYDGSRTVTWACVATVSWEAWQPIIVGAYQGLPVYQFKNVDTGMCLTAGTFWADTHIYQDGCDEPYQLWQLRTAPGAGSKKFLYDLTRGTYADLDTANEIPVIGTYIRRTVPIDRCADSPTSVWRVAAFS
ncbi:hypothetical protein [Frankia sp. Cr2]|uniref:hypothetical protein n=1 Tax=Frankia sp. Cr2 TaxID=3073932 RepID=UPI002AD2ABDA|nr:hypothetical protein [Frankia sp. Cr2]